MRRIVNWSLALLAVASLFVWACSYVWPANEAENVWSVGAPAGEGTFRFSLCDGKLGFKYGELCMPPYPKTRVSRFWGVSYAVVVFPGSKNGYRLHMFNVHVGLLVVLFGISPVVALVRGPVRRAWRLRHGCCEACGYDLTGNVSGVCSECGAAPAQK